MWLPVEHTFSRNESEAAIAKGKYNNIRGIFSASASTPRTGKWKTAQQAIADGNVTTPTYSLFAMVRAASLYIPRDRSLFQASALNHCPVPLAHAGSNHYCCCHFPFHLLR